MGERRVSKWRAFLAIQSAAIGAAAELHSGPAPAQEAAGWQYPVAPPPVTVTLHAENGRPLLVELYHPDARVAVDPPIARCTTPCFARLVPGRYRLYLHETADTLGGGRVFDLRESASIVVSPDPDSQRTTGLGLAIGGHVATIAGALLLLSSVCTEECRSSNDNVAPGILLLVGGLAAIPVGWTMFGKSFRPELTLSPMPPTGQASPIVIGQPRGAALELRVTL